MFLTQLLLIFVLWTNDQVVSFVSSITTTTETTDLEDGDPNHYLWKEMSNPERSLSFNR